jgi:hypothetical protein
MMNQNLHQVEVIGGKKVRFAAFHYHAFKNDQVKAKQSGLFT